MPRPKPQRAIGGEENLARRIRRELTARAWTPAELAHRMTDAGCRIGTSSVYKILDTEKPRTISVDEFISLASVFDTTTDELLTPVEALEQREVQELLKDLDAGERQMLDGVMRYFEATFKLLQLAGDEPELYAYVKNHHWRRAPSDSGATPLLHVVTDDGERVDVDDSALREGVAGLYAAIVEQAGRAVLAGDGDEA